MFKKTAQKAKRIFAYDDLKDGAQYIKSTTQTALQKDEQAATVNRYSQLSPEDIQKSSQSYRRLFILMSSLSGLGVLYFLVALFTAHFQLAFCVFLFIVVCGSQTFKYHFHLTQLKNKKLNLTLKEWVAQFKSGKGE